jgi:hypothetical protein
MSIKELLAEYYLLKGRIGEMYTLVYNQVSAEATLDGLTNASKTSEYNLWMWMSAAMAVIQQQVWADKQAQIQERIDGFIPIPDRWLQSEVLKFQFGDTLVWDNDLKRYKYAVLDASKQIIKRCAVIRSGGTTFVKVATQNAPLTAPQLVAFNAYLQDIIWAGSNVETAVSQPADVLDARMTVYYDGSKPLAEIKSIVEAAFNEYLINDDTKPGTVPFNGQYSINKHADYIESAAPALIREVSTGVVRYKPNGGVYTDVNRVFTPVAGWIVKDGTISFDAMIQYVAE